MLPLNLIIFCTNFLLQVCCIETSFLADRVEVAELPPVHLKIKSLF